MEQKLYKGPNLKKKKENRGLHEACQRLNPIHCISPIHLYAIDQTMEVGQCAWRRDWPRVLLRCLSAETGWETERETERESWRGRWEERVGEVRGSNRLPDRCVAEQRGLWHCHRHHHGFCVVAVIWRRDRGKQGNQSSAEWRRTELLNAISLVFIFTWHGKWLTWLDFFFITPIHFLQQAETRPTTESELFFSFRPWKSLLVGSLNFGLKVYWGSAERVALCVLSLTHCCAL